MKQQLNLIIGLLFGVFSIGAGAHVTSSCLMVLEQKAFDLKQCIETKGRENCGFERQLISNQIKECRQEQLSDDELEHAIKMGESYAQGTAAYHLGPSLQDSEKVATITTRGNIDNFRRQFAHVKAFPVEILQDGINVGGCNRAYLAALDRYNFLGKVELKRYDADDIDAEYPHTLYFFESMLEGTCYDAPSTGQVMSNGDRVVVNIPENFFTYLRRASKRDESKAVVVRCANAAECDDKKRQVLALQLDYQATFLRLKRLNLCKASDGAGGWFRRATRARPTIDTEELPAYCDAENLDKNIEELSATLEKTGEQLFERL